MAQPLPLDDPRTLQAIGILADALDDVSGAGALDTVLVSKALRQVLASRSRPAFDFASRAFSTLDPEVKRQVAVDATTKAREQAARGIGRLERNERVEAAVPMNVRKAATATPPSSPGILGALNSRGRGPRRPAGGEDRS